MNTCGYVTMSEKKRIIIVKMNNYLKPCKFLRIINIK